MPAWHPAVTPDTSKSAYSRYLTGPLEDALKDTPAVLIHGPRQSGKTTLAKKIGEKHGFRYFTFDDDVVRSSAQSDPVGFVADLPEKSILDEIQRVPSLFTALKAAIDRKRIPGRFILTGSSNVLLIPKLADSLAGRLGILRLYPLAQCEIESSEPTFLENLFGAGFKNRPYERLGIALSKRLASGGFPDALARSNYSRQSAWYRDYVEALIQRDIREMARIESLDILQRLMSLTAGYTSKLVNIAELAAPFHLSRQTISDYVSLLERIFLLDRLPPWFNNRMSRLVKTPKLHIGDTGLASALQGITAEELHADKPRLGPLVETFVFQELRKQASWREPPIGFFHFRDKDGVEVDLVLEEGINRIAGVEIKASSTVTDADFRGLRKLKQAVGKHFVGGALLYDGEASLSFGERLYAVPIRSLWEA